MQNSVSGLLKPRLVEVISKTPNHSKIVIEPLERGMHCGVYCCLRYLVVQLLM
jgi:DNA-directed RNA polymerase subunit alpha